MAWYEQKIEKFSPVISTRIRLARNIEDIPFPHRLSPSGKISVWERVLDALAEKDFTPVNFKNLSQKEKNAFVEERLASPALLKEGEGKGLILSREKGISVMVNEEDHIRLQVLSQGKNLSGALALALETEEILRKKLTFAYREGLGYLTACPTNLGAALRVSVMIHLPALTALSAASDLAKNLSHRGFTVRGVFGEGSAATCGIYQISNQISREKSPEEIIFLLEQVILQVEAAEQQAALKLMEEEGDLIRDKICRAIGLLRYARQMSYLEFVEHFSAVRFGKALGLTEARETPLKDGLLFTLSPFKLSLEEGEEDSKARDIKRCKRIKEELEQERN